MSDVTRLIVVDDHRVVRDGLREMIRRTDIRIVAEAADGVEALREIEANEADLLILDISLPVLGGIELLKKLRQQGASLPVLFFSMHPPEQYAAFLQKSGAQGFLSKEAGAQEVLDAIDKVVRGETYFPTLDPLTASHPSDALASLSPRERQVMFGMLEGKSQTEIARELQVTNKSVGTYRGRILSKCGVRNNAELIVFATRLGLGTPSGA